MTKTWWETPMGGSVLMVLQNFIDLDWVEQIVIKFKP
jgi:hypothetical protein